jgi:O-antigen/teichoic acid export membrane protein
MTLALNTLAMFVSHFFVRGMGMATFFVSRRLLGPVNVGVWNVIQTVTGYVMAANTGAVLGAEREIPYWRGKGDAVEEDAVRRQMFSAAFAESCLAGAAVLLLALLFGGRFRPEIGAGLLWAAAYVVLWRMSEACLIALRTLQEFVLLARLQVVLCFTDFVLIVGFIWVWGLPGQCVAFAASFLTRILIFGGAIRRRKFFTLGWRFDVPLLKRLLSVGFPLVVNGFLWQWMTSIHGLIVAKTLGVATLGFYSLGISAAAAAGEIPSAFSAIIFPRVMQDFGADDDPRRLGQNTYRYLKATVFFLVPLTIVSLYFSLPFVARRFLKEFLPGIPAMKALVFGGTCLALSHIPVQAFYARAKTAWVTCVNCGACLAVMGAAWAFSSHGLTAVAWAVSACYAAYFLLLTQASLSRTLGPREAWQGTGVLAAGMAYLVGLLSGADRLMAPSPEMTFKADLLRTGAAAAIALAGAAPLLWRADKHLGLWARVKELWTKRS